MAEVVQLADARERRVAREKRESEPWVSKREIAEHFGVTTRAVENWMSKRGMPHRKPYPTGNVYFRVSDCDQWMLGDAS